MYFMYIKNQSDEEVQRARFGWRVMLLFIVATTLATVFFREHVPLPTVFALLQC